MVDGTGEELVVYTVWLYPSISWTDTEMRVASSIGRALEQRIS
jgi:hypothetical protein